MCLRMCVVSVCPCVCMCVGSLYNYGGRVCVSVCVAWVPLGVCVCGGSCVLPLSQAREWGWPVAGLCVGSVYLCLGVYVPVWVSWLTDSCSPSH